MRWNSLNFVLKAVLAALVIVFFATFILVPFELVPENGYLRAFNVYKEPLTVLTALFIPSALSSMAQDPEIIVISLLIFLSLIVSYLLSAQAKQKWLQYLGNIMGLLTVSFWMFMTWWLLIFA